MQPNVNIAHATAIRHHFAAEHRGLLAKYNICPLSQNRRGNAEAISAWAAVIAANFAKS